MIANEAESKWDCLIVGGGLAGGLLLQALRFFQPTLRVLLLEKASKLGGNHTWCFHSSDLLPNDIDWLKPLISKKWSSYEVHFPRYHREIQGGYCAIRSEDFSSRLLESHSLCIQLNTPVAKVTAQSVTLENGDVLSADTIIDARGWASNANTPKNGYQKFLGLDVRLKAPHQRSRVTLKDVRVLQTDGYRFFYVLPWNEDELLVEDTYYSNSPDLNSEVLRKRVLDYIAEQGWEVDKILREEIGCLPLDLYPSKTCLGSEGPLMLGAASGIFQPVTGYTLPQTFERVHALASTLDRTQWRDILSRLNQKHHAEAGYLRLLNRMMFLAAEPDQRYVILERFYEMSEGLIARFYQGKLKTKDKIRILCGKPPVNVWRALKVVFSQR